MSDPKLPMHLEDALLALLHGVPNGREDRFDELGDRLEILVRANPAHADALHARFDEMILEDGTATIGSGEPRIEWHDPPDYVGPYRILATLGTGGMGVVYLAEQTEPVRRDVAVKVIKLGMNSEDVLTRFEVERQALAMLNHPGIAKVFDAGVSDDGQPYFVMEYARGVSLHEFCDEHQLTVNGRIQIFQQICMAVQHAHQKGVLHRDLKPANILCTREGLQPVIKIIDFGLARATDQGTVARTLFTEQGKIIGTPEYMSPEQARGDAAVIDTRTDIYSLGVILYQLLTGVLPFHSLELRSVGLLEVYRLIQEGDPGRPSSRVGATEHGASVRARNRKLSPASLRKTLQGDLDWIVMKAMGKEPDRRYDSATAFAMDLRRYLKHEPVEAGPPGAHYRFTRFVRRFRIQIAAAVVVFAALVASFFLVWSFAMDASEKLALANAATTKADNQEAQAQKLGKRAARVSAELAAKDLEIERLRARADALGRDLAQAREGLGRETQRADRSEVAVRASAAEVARLTQALEAATQRVLALEKSRAGLLLATAELAEHQLAERLRGVLAAARTLLPAGPKDVASIQSWLRDAALLEGKLPGVRKWRDASAGKTETETETETAPHRAVRLARLEGEFAALPPLRRRIQRELRWVRRSAELSREDPAVRTAWDRARLSVRANRRYGKLDLAPQLGLVPLGANPRTGLFEFYHLRSAWPPDAKDVDVRLPPLAGAGPTYRGRLPEVYPGIVFVLVPGRTVRLDGERVELDPFLLAKHELTQEQWLNLQGEVSPSVRQPGTNVGARIVTGRHPVENIDCGATERMLRDFGLVLPTEAQWEHACWGGAPRREIPDAEAFLRRARRPVANVLDRAARGLFVGAEASFHDGFAFHAPVGRFAANGFGLHDMLGNVEEWCRGEDARGRRAVRGGSFRTIAARSLPEVRSWAHPANRSGARGLRSCRPVR